MRDTDLPRVAFVELLNSDGVAICRREARWTGEDFQIPVGSVAAAMLTVSVRFTDATGALLGEVSARITDQDRSKPHEKEEGDLQ